MAWERIRHIRKRGRDEWGKVVVWTAHVAWLVARLGEAVHDVYWERPIRDVQRIEHAIKRTPRKQYEQAVTDAGPRAGAQL